MSSDRIPKSILKYQPKEKEVQKDLCSNGRIWFWNIYNRSQQCSLQRIPYIPSVNSAAARRAILSLISAAGVDDTSDCLTSFRTASL